MAGTRLPIVPGAGAFCRVVVLTSSSIPPWKAPVHVALVAQRSLHEKGLKSATVRGMRYLTPAVQTAGAMPRAGDTFTARALSLRAIRPCIPGLRLLVGRVDGIPGVNHVVVASEPRRVHDFAALLFSKDQTKLGGRPRHATAQESPQGVNDVRIVTKIGLVQ